MPNCAETPDLEGLTLRQALKVGVRLKAEYDRGYQDGIARAIVHLRKWGHEALADALDAEEAP